MSNQISPAAAELGRRIRVLRLELGLTQGQLGTNCDLDRTYVGSVERGERNVSLKNIIRLAEALGVDTGELTAGLRSRRTRRRN